MCGVWFISYVIFNSEKFFEVFNMEFLFIVYNEGFFSVEGKDIVFSFLVYFVGILFVCNNCVVYCKLLEV